MLANFSSETYTGEIIMRYLLSIVTLLSVLNVNAAQLVFTAIPDQDETSLTARFNIVADYLARELGVDVKYIPVKSYAASVTAFRNGEVHLAWFGGLTGVQAVLLTPGAVAIAQGDEDQGFVSYLIANTKTGIEYSDAFPEQIAGLNFTFGSKSSTSGRLMPEYFIRQHFGKSPEEVFRRVGFTDNHSQTIRLIESGSYDVGVLNSEVWATAVDAGEVDTEKVRLIWITPEYPNYHWAVRGDVDETFGAGFKEKLKQVLLAIEDPDVLNAFPRKSFVETSNDNYKPILDTAREIGLID